MAKAGRPKGAKDSLDRPGSKADTIAKRAGLKTMPLEFLAKVYQGTQAPAGFTASEWYDRRIEAAKAALPYLHRKMPVETHIHAKGTITHVAMDATEKFVEELFSRGGERHGLVAGGRTLEHVPLPAGECAGADEGGGDADECAGGESVGSAEGAARRRR